MERLFLCAAVAAMLTIPAQAEVTVCYGATDCQTVSPGGTRQWGQEEAISKFLSDAHAKIYDAQSACQFADDPQACRDAAQTFIQALRRTR